MTATSSIPHHLARSCRRRRTSGCARSGSTAEGQHVIAGSPSRCQVDHTAPSPSPATGSPPRPIRHSSQAGATCWRSRPALAADELIVRSCRILRSRYTQSTLCRSVRRSRRLGDVARPPLPASKLAVAHNGVARRRWRLHPPPRPPSLRLLGIVADPVCERQAPATAQR